MRILLSITPWYEYFNAIGVTLSKRNPLLIHMCIDVNHTMKHTYQRRRCCAFDSPGLPNDSAGYPGLAYGLRGTTPSVLRFFLLIRHKRVHCERAFSEKAQHLWRWISLRTLTWGRLVPRQPRAIKKTTRTELRGEAIVSVAWLIIKGRTICVISLCKIRQNTWPLDANYRVKWRCL